MLTLRSPRPTEAIPPRSVRPASRASTACCRDTGGRRQPDFRISDNRSLFWFVCAHQRRKLHRRDAELLGCNARRAEFRPDGDGFRVRRDGADDHRNGDRVGREHPGRGILPGCPPRAAPQTLRLRLLPLRLLQGRRRLARPLGELRQSVHWLDRLSLDLHELGHALGLKHSHDSEVSPTPPFRRAGTGTNSR